MRAPSCGQREGPSLSMLHKKMLQKAKLSKKHRDQGNQRLLAEAEPTAAAQEQLASLLH